MIQAFVTEYSKQGVVWMTPWLGASLKHKRSSLHGSSKSQVGSDFKSKLILIELKLTKKKRKAMENPLREQFRIARPGRANEAAMFVENNIVITQQESPVYADQLDHFVSVEEGIKQQRIRYLPEQITFDYTLMPK